MARLQIGKSPMFTASYYGHLDVMKALIEAGDNVNQLDKVSTPIFSATVIQSHPYFHTYDTIVWVLIHAVYKV